MRKGADVLSKWVGEAERQLRLLFEEAQKAQPAIIFFDEIDGLAPVSLTAEPANHHNVGKRPGSLSVCAWNWSFSSWPTTERLVTGWPLLFSAIGAPS